MYEPDFEILVFESTQLEISCKVTGYNMGRNRFLYWVKQHLSSSFESSDSKYQIHAFDDKKMVMIVVPFTDSMRAYIVEVLESPSATSESDLDD